MYEYTLIDIVWALKMHFQIKKKKMYVSESIFYEKKS